jgi:hypothetical protein
MRMSLQELMAAGTTEEAMEQARAHGDACHIHRRDREHGAAVA